MRTMRRSEMALADRRGEHAGGDGNAAYRRHRERKGRRRTGRAAARGAAHREGEQREDDGLEEHAGHELAARGADRLEDAEQRVRSSASSAKNSATTIAGERERHVDDAVERALLLLDAGDLVDGVAFGERGGAPPVVGRCPAGDVGMATPGAAVDGRAVWNASGRRLLVGPVRSARTSRQTSGRTQTPPGGGRRCRDEARTLTGTEAPGSLRPRRIVCPTRHRRLRGGRSTQALHRVRRGGGTPRRRPRSRTRPRRGLVAGPGPALRRARRRSPGRPRAAPARPRSRAGGMRERMMESQDCFENTRRSPCCAAQARRCCRCRAHRAGRRGRAAGTRGRVSIPSRSGTGRADVAARAA